MQIITLHDREITRFGSHGALMTIVADIPDSSMTAVRVTRLEPGGTLGRHRAPVRQTFALIDGSGWVSGGDGEPRAISAGHAAIWAPGEDHESGTERSMVVVIVESDARPAHGGAG